jgi:hypothetical protein
VATNLAVILANVPRVPQQFSIVPFSSEKLIITNPRSPASPFLVAAQAAEQVVVIRNKFGRFPILQGIWSEKQRAKLVGQYIMPSSRAFQERHCYSVPVRPID